MKRMTRCFFLIGYWLVHIAGIFPLKLKSEKNRSQVTSHDARRISWTPWTSSRRTCLIEFGHVFLILYSSTWLFVWNTDEVEKLDWIEGFLEMLMNNLITMGKVCVTVSSVLTATMQRREIEQLLNNICSVYFAILKRTDHPPIRKFTYLILYGILSFIAIVVIWIWVAFQSRNVQNLLWQLSYMFTFLYMEIIWGVLLVYIQSTVEELNREIKSRFPRVDTWDWKCWESSNSEEENQRRINAKSFPEEYRRTYKTVSDIVDQLNSVYGYLLLITIVCNQVASLILGFCYISMFLTSSPNDIEGGNFWHMMSYAFSCVWCFVRISVIVHGYEIVIKEVQVTTYYIASLDASEIDRDSKMELLEFLDEIDGREIRFMAGNMFSLDNATLYLMLTTTVTYIVIIIQHLSP